MDSKAFLKSQTADSTLPGLHSFNAPDIPASPADFAGKTLNVPAEEPHYKK